MFKFNNEDVFTGYVKNMLSTFNLPKCRVFKDEESCKNFASGLQTLDEVDDGFFCIIKNWKNNKDSIVYFKNLELNKSKIIFITYYSYGRYYRNITSTFNNTDTVYGTKTHEYLGDYLRFKRDFKNIDLMPLYNCYSNYFFEVGNYKYVSLSIRYNQQYTICLNQNSSFKYIKTLEDDENEIIKIFNTEVVGGTKITTVPHCNFKEPTIVKVGKPTSIEDINKEKHLRLIIQLPIKSSSVINVLEGVYRNTSKNVVTNNEKDESNKYIYNYDDVNLSNYYNNISLLNEKWSFKTETIPFSNRLVEYLTGLIITKDDPISRNIINCKYSYLTKYTNKTKTDINKVKSKIHNIDIFNISSVVSINTFCNIDNKDLLYYIDKDIEYLLNDRRYPKIKEDR